MNNLKKYVVSTSKNGEVQLLLNISHEIMNYRKNFKGKLRKTFIMSEDFSSAFGIQIVNNQPYLGIPNDLFEFFFHVRWVGIKATNGRSGIYLLFKTGPAENLITCAIKLNMRNKRVKALLQYKKVTLVKMTEDHKLPELERYNNFGMLVKEVDELHWEKE